MQRHDHPADHDDGQRLLRLRAHPGREGGRQQAEDRRQGRDRHRPDQPLEPVR